MTPEDLEAVRTVVREALSVAAPRRSRSGLLTLEQASEFLAGTPKETIRHWIWEGRLQGYKPGAHVLVRESDLLALVEANETRAKRVARKRARV